MRTTDVFLAQPPAPVRIVVRLMTCKENAQQAQQVGIRLVLGL
ncbi:hypothetical protein [Streptomyces sp. NPDC051577]